MKIFQIEGWQLGPAIIGETHHNYYDNIPPAMYMYTEFFTNDYPWPHDGWDFTPISEIIKELE